MSLRARACDERVYGQAGEILGVQVSHPEITELFRFVAKHSGQSFICAGAVRDSLLTALTQQLLQPRDIDICIQGLSTIQFRILGERLGAVPNDYGGYCTKTASGMEVDFWLAKNTTGIKFHNVSPSIRNVLRSFVLDLNAVSFDPITRKFCDHGALSAIRRKQIGFVKPALFHSEANFAARAVLLSRKLGFQLSAELSEFVSEWLDAPSLQHQLKKLAPAELSQEAALILRDFGSGTTYSAIGA
jgi:hypothetical protein